MPPTSAKKLGAFIKRHRKERGLSLEAVAQEVKVPRSTIFRMERGEFGSPDPEKLQRLATALDVDFEELFTLAGHVAPDPGLQPYLRRKYDLSDEAIEKAERYLERLRHDDQGGPRA